MRALIAAMRRMAAAADAATSDAYVFSVDLSRAYGRRRYTLSYRYFVGGLCVRAGSLILLDVTKPDAWVRPLTRPTDRAGDPVLEAWHALGSSDAVVDFIVECTRAGIRLNRFSTTVEEVEQQRAA